LAQLRVGEDDELSHDGCDDDSGGLSSFHAPLIERPAICVEPASDERWHVEGLARESSSATNVGVTFPRPRLPFHWRKTCEACGLIAFKAARLRHFDEQGESGDFRDAGNEEETLEPPVERRFIEDELFDGGVGFLNFHVDLDEPLFLLPFGQRKRGSASTKTRGEPLRPGSSMRIHSRLSLKATTPPISQSTANGARA